MGMDVQNDTGDSVDLNTSGATGRRVCSGRIEHWQCYQNCLEFDRFVAVSRSVDHRQQIAAVWMWRAAVCLLSPPFLSPSAADVAQMSAHHSAECVEPIRR